MPLEVSLQVTTIHQALTLNFLDRLLSQTVYWMHTWDELSTLEAEQYLSWYVINTYLVDMWFGMSPAPLVRYIDIQFVGGWDTDHPEHLEIYQQPRFQQLYRLTDTNPIIPLVFVMRQSDHFFAVVFDMEHHTVHIIGQTSRADVIHDWTEWNGPQCYSHLAFLHGWEVEDPSTVTVHSIPWSLNGYDCGPDAVGAVEFLCRHGVHVTFDGVLERPPRVCGHLTRLAMLSRLRQICADGYANYVQFRVLNPPPTEWSVFSVGPTPGIEEIPPHHPTVSAIRRGVGPRDAIKRSLTEASRDCTSCQTAQQAVHRATTEREEVVIGTQVRSSNHLSGRPIPTQQPSVTDVPGRLDGQSHKVPSEVTEGVATFQDLSLLQQLEQQEDQPIELESMQVLTRPVKRFTTKDANYTYADHHRFPRPVKAVYLPEPSKPLWPAFNWKFDRYFDTPTVEDFPNLRDPLEIPPKIDAYYNFNKYGMISTFERSFWTTFTDYGYRIKPSFAHNFYLCDPILPTAHVLPIGTSPDYDPRSLSCHPSLDTYSLDRSGNPSGTINVAVQDVLSCGIGTLFDLAPHATTTNSHDVFIRGKAPSGQYIALDMEQDSVPLTRTDIEVSIDVDSLIWITTRVITKLAVKVLSGPNMSNTAPLKKSNHVHVDILLPPHDGEVVGDTRPWEEENVPLSALPHCEWAKVVDGSGPISVYIVFPRMMHRHEHSGRRMTIIPYEVQLAFWDHVINPAIASVIGSSSKSSYLSYTVDENKQRRGKGRSAVFKSFPFTRVEFDAIQRKMKEIVNQTTDETLLARFGSFFFVLEAKGIKLNTFTVVHPLQSEMPDPDPWDKLKTQFPHLDLEYMVDRKHGELFVDLGFTFHPKTLQPLVGLWRLDALEASFGAGGYRKGYIHPNNTLARYGGLQAEMTKERARRSHVLFRSSYCLHYEAVRTAKNEPYFTQDGDAYSVNVEFMEECNRRVLLLQGSACKNSYGVRDEYRMGGKAVKSVLMNCADMVSKLKLS